MTGNLATLITSIVALVLGASSIGAIAMLGRRPPLAQRWRHEPEPEPMPAPLAPVLELDGRRPLDDALPVYAYPPPDTASLRALPAEWCGATPEGENAPRGWICTKLAGHFPHTLHETDTGGTWGDHTFTKGLASACPACGSGRHMIGTGVNGKAYGNLYCSDCGAYLGPAEHAHNYDELGIVPCWCGWGEPIRPEPGRPYVPTPLEPLPGDAS